MMYNLPKFESEKAENSHLNTYKTCTDGQADIGREARGTQGCQYCVLKKSENFAKCLTYVLPQATGLPRHRRSQLGGSAFPVFV